VSTYRKRDVTAFQFNDQENPARIVDAINKLSGTSTTATCWEGYPNSWNLQVEDPKSGMLRDVDNFTYVYSYNGITWRTMPGWKFEEQFGEVTGE
jgi:hypothetical protein